MLLELQMPPSANASYSNVPGKGRAKTKAYKAWRRAAAGFLRVQAGKYRAREPVAVAIIVFGGTGFQMGRDLDNMIKPTLDAMTEAELMPDDTVSHVYAEAIRFVPYADRPDLTAEQKGLDGAKRCRARCYVSINPAATALAPLLAWPREWCP